MKYIDIHTHNATTKKNRVEIINCFPHQEIENNHYCSIGLHPWFIRNNTDDSWIGDIKEKLNKKNVIAVGETGLDRVSKIDLHIQQKIFETHLEIAQQHELPVFIHCVRAYADLLWYKKQLKPQIPWIIHGFSENQQIANELIKHGCYLSFGKDLFLTHKKIKSYFAEIPINMIFFETDDDFKYTIEEVYTQASSILKIPVDELKQQIYLNFEKIFPGILENERLAATD